MKVTGLLENEVNKEPTKAAILKAYETMAEKYNERIDHKPHNAYYDRPNTLKLVGDVKGYNILDAACGPGKYAEILLKQGANVVGFDMSPKMVKYAQQRNESLNRFFVHDLSMPLNMFQMDHFDMVLCTLALHYVKDWNPVVQEFHRVLKNGGQVVVSIEHPFFEYTYFKSKQYFTVERVKAIWRGFGKKVVMPSFRRSLDACLRPFTNNGFYIDELIEPLPVDKFEELDPKHFKELNQFPAFMCFKAIKK